MDDKDKVIAHLRKRPENQLTQSERELVFGKGNTDTVMYRSTTLPDGREVVVSRSFGGDANPGPEWKDSPAEFGVVTEPSREQRPDGGFDMVIADVAKPQSTDVKRRSVA